MEIRLKPEILGPLRKDSSPNLTSLFRDWYRLGHKIVGVSGPRNCSKTATIAILLLWLHQQIPGLHSRVARSEASTIKSTIIDTFEELLAYPFGKTSAILLRSTADPTDLSISFSITAARCFSAAWITKPINSWVPGVMCFSITKLSES